MTRWLTSPQWVGQIGMVGWGEVQESPTVSDSVPTIHPEIHLGNYLLIRCHLCV